MMGSIRLPTILIKKEGKMLALIILGKGEGGTRTPSIIPHHVKYNMSTDAVSRTVATNYTSTFKFVPC